MNPAGLAVIKKQGILLKKILIGGKKINISVRPGIKTIMFTGGHGNIPMKKMLAMIKKHTLNNT